MVPETIATIAQQQSAAVRERAKGAAHIKKVLDIDAIDHHPAKQQHPRWRRAEVAKMLTQFSPVKLHHLQRPPDVDGTGFIRVIIRRKRTQAIFHRPLFFQKRQRLASRSDKGFDQILTIVGLTDDGPQIGFDFLRAAACGHFPRLIAIVDPHRAAGNGGGAAELRGFFQHQHRQPLTAGGHRRGKACGAAADNDDVPAFHAAAPCSCAMAPMNCPINFICASAISGPV